jgi:ubiquinone/menaquinone biosynthesis C-methylase UbiE
VGIISRFEKFFVNRASERNAQKFLEMIREGISVPRGTSMLELGAGKGALSYLLYQNFVPRRLVVTDYDPSQVALAGSYFKSKLGGIPESIETKAADALSLPFANESFDSVFARFVLHHVEKRRWHFRSIPRALNEIHRVLKVDGLLVYQEAYNKSRIQEYLATSGFDKIFEKGNWHDCFCIFRKNYPVKSPSRSEC